VPEREQNHASVPLGISGSYLQELLKLGQCDGFHSLRPFFFRPFGFLPRPFLYVSRFTFPSLAMSFAVHLHRIRPPSMGMAIVGRIFFEANQRWSVTE
jgi:hypothetical protein